MSLRSGGRHFVLSVLMLVLATVALSSPAASARSGGHVVLTRNLYLGADLAPVIAAPDGPALVTAAAGVWLDVQATDFPSRAVLLAEEIDRTRPDLVGLQEAALWRTGALLDPGPATDVRYDFLATLLDELAALGLAYDLAVVQQTFDGEVPAAVSPSGVAVLQDIRLTQRNAILVRDGVPVTNPRSEYFAINTVVPDVGGIPGNDLVDLRGWVSVDVPTEPSGRPFRFLNTHLDPYVPVVRNAQAQELVDGPLATPLKSVAVGDFNSPPAGPGSEAYRLLTDPANGRLRDVWTNARAGVPGFTCCQASDLTNPTDTASQRIDLVLVRTPAVRVEAVDVVGTTARTPTGLWASDHFGVVAELSVP